MVENREAQEPDEPLDFAGRRESRRDLAFIPPTCVSRSLNKADWGRGRGPSLEPNPCLASGKWTSSWRNEETGQNGSFPYLASYLVTFPWTKGQGNYLQILSYLSFQYPSCFLTLALARCPVKGPDQHPRWSSTAACGPRQQKHCRTKYAWRQTTASSRRWDAIVSAAQVKPSLRGAFAGLWGCHDSLQTQVGAVEPTSLHPGLHLQPALHHARQWYP